MNLLHKIKQNLKTVFVSVLAIAVVAAPATAFAGFYPDRPVKDWNNVADRGGFDHVVFNSFINTPYYGDERHFLDTRAGSGNDAADNYKDVLEGVKDGDTLTLRTYIHNNGNQDLNGANFDGPTVAKNAKVRILLPTGTNLSLRATSYISADNADPGTVSDTSDFKSSTPFSVQYIPGSATLVTGVNGGSEFKMSDSVVTTGAPIGYNQLNGVVPGCFEYQAFVYIKVKVTTPGLDFQKQVKIGSGTYQEQVEAKPGDTVKWRLAYKNSGSAQINNTIIKDKLPANLTLVPGSVTLVDAKHATGLKLSDGDLFDSNGTNAGSYTAGSNGYITFETTVAAADKLPACSVTLTNVANSQADNVPSNEDTASVIVKKNCVPPTTTTTPPATLVNTGPGDVAGIFAAVTVAGAMVHKFILGRRYQ